LFLLFTVLIFPIGACHYAGIFGGDRFPPFCLIIACDLHEQVAVTPLSLSPYIKSDIQMAASDWVSAVLPDGQ